MLRIKWFEGLGKIAEAHPELFPAGIVDGVLLNVRAVLNDGFPTDQVIVTPGIAAMVPVHVANDVRKLYQSLFLSAG